MQAVSLVESLAALRQISLGIQELVRAPCQHALAKVQGPEMASVRATVHDPATVQDPATVSDRGTVSDLVMGRAPAWGIVR